MAFRRKILALLLLLFFPRPAHAFWSCFTEVLVYFGEGIAETSRPHSLPPAGAQWLHPAVAEVVARLRPPAIEPFDYSAGQRQRAESAAFETKWLRAAKPTERLRGARTLVMTESERDKAEVLRVVHEGKTSYFRPTDSGRNIDIREARYTINAARVSAFFDSKLVPAARLAIVNGRSGVLIDEAPGAIGHRRIDEASRDEAFFLEFLLGQTDGAQRNFSIEPNGALHFFDHGWAFHPGVPSADHGYGDTLPRVYPRAMLEKLRDTSPDAWREFFRGQLTATELEAFLFRREILLEDSRTKATR